MENNKREVVISKLKKLAIDLKNGTSYSVDYLLSPEVNETLSEKGIKIRKVFSPLLRLIYGFKTDYKLVIDSREEIKENDNGTIFVVNHRQSDDIVLGAKAIAESGYFVFGNKYLSFDTQNGLGLWAYGMILVDRDNELSRQSTYEKMKYVLKNKGNVIIYPEGYWNLDDNGLGSKKHGPDDHNSENWLMQDFNLGSIRLAQETGANIVPTVLHYDEFKGKKCYAKRGKALTISKDDNIIVKKDELKEIMQIMYYDLMEKYSSYTRAELEVNGKTLKEKWGELKKELVAACDIKKTEYRLDLDDEKSIGKAKVVNPVVTNEEVFEHLDKITYNKDNAFLLSKKLTGRRK